MAHYFVFALDTHFLMENLQYICKSLEHRADSAQRDLHLSHLATYLLLNTILALQIVFLLFVAVKQNACRKPVHHIFVKTFITILYL